jgi:hypothetical protein
MQVAVSDCAQIDQLLPIVVKYNVGILDDHWGLWRGKIDVARVLDQLLEHAPDAVWTIETGLADVERSLVWLQEQGHITRGQ